MIEVRRIRGDDPAALALTAAMEADVAATDGPVTPERTSVVSALEMCPPSGVYVVVVEDGVAVAGGGVRRLDDGVGEVKRMFTMPSVRGRGHARRVLIGLEEAARALGYERLRLDTAHDRPASIALYESSGYVPIPDYNGNSYATFWAEKRLS